MRYRFVSDIHLERDIDRKKNATIDDLWRPVPHADDHKTVLILAGDIWNGVRPLKFANRSWIKELAGQFAAVIAVLGNHDYWTENLHTLSEKWRTNISQQGLKNVHLLELADGVEHGSIVIDGVRILGATLWTDMHNHDPMVSSKFDLELGFDGKPLFNDRNYIRVTGGYRPFNARHWLDRHILTRRNLLAALQIGTEPVLLITHHAPCMISAPPQGSDVLSTYLYGSDLSNLILDHPRIKTAIHGHTHVYYDYMMGDVRVRCNPRGYAPGSIVREFDPVASGEM